MKCPAELSYITIAQIVGCWMVILGHSIPFVTSYPSGVASCITFLYAFHMPLFVWCSGFLFAYTKQSDRKSFSQYIEQRAVKLLIPYFVISLIGMVPKILAPQFLNDTLNMDFMSIVRAFLVPREGVWGHFWFLPMIYLIGAIGYMLDTISKKTSDWIIVVIVSFALSFCRYDALEWLGVNDVLQYFIFYALGIVCSRIITNVNIPISYIVSAVLASIVLFLSITSNADLIHTRNTLIAMLMILSIVQLCKKYADSIKVDRKSLIAQTYQIFILLWPCQLVAGIIVERILHLSWMVFIPIVFTTGIIVPLTLLKLIDEFEAKTHTKVISFVLGR